MIKLIMLFTALAALIVIIAACDNYSHNSIVNTPPANYVNLLMTRTYGSSGYEWGTSMLITADKEQIITGATSSVGYGEYSLYLIKSDSLGNLAWVQHHGGRGVDVGEAMAFSPDSNLIIAGMTNSFDLVDGHELDPALGDREPWDLNFFLVKTDLNGLSYWEKVYGDTNYVEHATSVIALSDGYLAAGYQTQNEEEQIFVVRTDLDGDLIWQNAIGTDNPDRCFDLTETSDGNFLLAGHTRETPNGTWDAYFIKIDAAGTVLWEKTHGAAGADERIYSVIRTSDNGFAAVGQSGSTLYAVRMDASGNLVWQGTYGPSGIREGRSILEDSNGQLIVCGQNSSVNAIQIAKLDGQGNLLWTDASGVNGYGMAMLPCVGGYLIAGTTAYPNMTVVNDALLIKIEEDLTNVE